MTVRQAAAPRAADVMRKAGRENFSVASLLLPAAERRHLLAVYGFARLVDDAGDEFGGDRDALLDALEEDLDRAFAGEPRHVLMRQLAPTIRELGLPREPFARLIEANRQDQRVSRYGSWDELAAYCELSANPVGRLVLHVFGKATPDRIEASDAVCTGLQLAEHWQDVGEDYRRGRVYLPQDDLGRFGVEEGELARERVTPSLAALLAFEVDRARRLVAHGLPLVRSLRGRQRVAVAGYVAGGRAALDAIERARYEVLGEPPKATRRARAAALARVLREAS